MDMASTPMGVPSRPNPVMTSSAITRMLGYTDHLNLTALLLAFAGLGVVWVMRTVGVRSISLYAVVGTGVWFGFHESGVHATIAGVILGLMTPTSSWVVESRVQQMVQGARGFVYGAWSSDSERRKMLRQVERAARESISPLERLENGLHPWQSFVIIPLFALANAGVPFDVSDLGESIAVAVMLGLFVGKPVGILLFSWLAVRAGLATLPTGVTWPIVGAGGMLAGIGFTMALFIDGLALQGQAQSIAKVGILAGSLLAAIVGMGLLVVLLPSGADAEAEQGAAH